MLLKPSQQERGLKYYSTREYILQLFLNMLHKMNKTSKWFTFMNNPSEIQSNHSDTATSPLALAAAVLGSL